MDFGKLLISYFLSTEQGEKIKPIFETLAKNNFDLVKTLKNADLTTLLPLVSVLFDNKKVPQPTTSVELAPIKNIANEQIINSLNDYFTTN